MSRIERAERTPRREVIERIAEALDLSQDDRRILLLAAGYVEAGTELTADPLVRQIAVVVSDPQLSDDVRTNVRRAIEALMELVNATPAQSGAEWSSRQNSEVS